MTDYYEQLARLFVSLVVALLALFGTSADPTTTTSTTTTTTTTTSTTSTTIPELVYRSPCHEDEDWLVVDYRTPGATEDVGSNADDDYGVTRLCVHFFHFEDIATEPTTSTKPN